MTEYLAPAGLHHIPGAFTPVVRVDGFVFLSGQVAWDEHGNVCGEDPVAQTRQIARNLDVALAAVGCGREDIVKETVYVVDYRPELIPGLFEALREGVPAAPASTLVGVAALFAPEVLVEVDVVAKVPAK